MAEQLLHDAHVGATVEQAQDSCAAAAGACWIANDNAPGQVVIGGTPEGLEAASARAKELGVKRVMALNVGGAFHTPLMQAAADAFADRVVGVLEDLAPGLAASVTAREVITPLDLERDYGLTGGHPLHGEQSLDQFFLWRPFLGSARYRLPIGGLYLCGSGAHPGGGVTGAPGHNAAAAILKDRRKLGL